MSFGRLNLWKYAFLAAPLAFGSLPLYMYMPDLFATEYGVSLAVLGIILLGIRLFDAIQDPIIGLLSRNWLHRHSALLRAMLFSLSALSIGIIILVYPLDAISPILRFALGMAIATTGLSIANILYQSIGAVWSSDYDTRTRITTAREACTLLGVLIAVSLPALLQMHFPRVESFQIFALFFIALLAPAAFIWAKWLKGTVLPAFSEKSTPSVRPLLKNSHALLLVWFLSQLASAIPVILVLFFIRDRLELAEYTGAFLLVYFLCGALGMPLWQKVSAKWGKKAAWQIAMIIAILSFFWAFWLNSGSWVGYGIICALSGLALGGELAIPPSMLADKLESAENAQNATVLFGIAAFLGKISLALASGIVLPLLQWNGYSASEVNAPEALVSLAMAYALLPCIIKAAAFIILSLSSIDTRRTTP